MQNVKDPVVVLQNLEMEIPEGVLLQEKTYLVLKQLEETGFVTFRNDDNNEEGEWGTAIEQIKDIILEKGTYEFCNFSLNYGDIHNCSEEYNQNEEAYDDCCYVIFDSKRNRIS